MCTILLTWVLLMQAVLITQNSTKRAPIGRVRVRARVFQGQGAARRGGAGGGGRPSNGRQRVWGRSRSLRSMPAAGPAAGPAASSWPLLRRRRGSATTMPATAHRSRFRLAQLRRHTAVGPGWRMYLGGGNGASTKGGYAQEEIQVQRLYDLIEDKMAEYHTTGVAFGICRGAQSALRAFGSAQSLPFSWPFHTSSLCTLTPAACYC
jgi:hypothetical protein